MCQPVTTPCGHTFCKACLMETLKMKLPDQRECVICRKKVYQSSLMGLQVNIALQNIFEKKYPKQMADRLRVIQEEKQRKEQE